MALRIKSDTSYTLKIDKLGRIVIPQAVRERLGLRPGTTLRLVEENHEAIVLEPVQEVVKIVYKNGWPVFQEPGHGGGETDIKKVIRETYEERMDHIAGMKNRKS